MSGDREVTFFLRRQVPTRHADLQLDDSTAGPEFDTKTIRGYLGRVVPGFDLVEMRPNQPTHPDSVAALDRTLQRSAMTMMMNLREFRGPASPDTTTSEPSAHHEQQEASFADVLEALQRIQADIEGSRDDERIRQGCHAIVAVVETAWRRMSLQREQIDELQYFWTQAVTRERDISSKQQSSPPSLAFHLLEAGEDENLDAFVAGLQDVVPSIVTAPQAPVLSVSPHATTRRMGIDWGQIALEGADELLRREIEVPQRIQIYSTFLDACNKWLMTYSQDVYEDGKERLQTILTRLAEVNTSLIAIAPQVVDQWNNSRAATVRRSICTITEAINRGGEFPKGMITYADLAEGSCSQYLTDLLGYEGSLDYQLVRGTQMEAQMRAMLS